MKLSEILSFTAKVFAHSKEAKNKKSLSHSKTCLQVLTNKQRNKQTDKQTNKQTNKILVTEKGQFKRTG